MKIIKRRGTGGKKDGEREREGRRKNGNRMWSEMLVAGISVSSNLCSGTGVSAARR